MITLYETDPPTICFHAFFPGKFVPSIVIRTFVATESATLPI